LQQYIRKFADKINQMKALHLSNFTATSALGRGLTQTLDALLQSRTYLTECNFEDVDLKTYIGKVQGVEAVALPAHLNHYNCRNNQLAQLGFAQDGFESAVRAAIARFGSKRVGVFLGTSTAGILQTELAYRRRDPVTDDLPSDFIYRTTHNTYSVADFTRAYFELEGPAVVISSACSSSAKVFSSARRMVDAGLIDAAIVGGVDSLCLTTLYGFNSLQLISDQVCRPFDASRNGISIGEAAAFALVERVPNNLPSDAILLLGIGESSDAYHMSSPHPEGMGANMAMQNALDFALLKPTDIDYINLHGTATKSNDAAEGKAVFNIFGSKTPCSSSKGATGHTLGAAGGLEAVVSALALQHSFMPAGVSTSSLDPSLQLNYLLKNQVAPVSRVLSNSFGFGGTNCSLIFGRAN
jgi:3-oxoacyl-[acyl-carrier-protein] synthase-1